MLIENCGLFGNCGFLVELWDCRDWGPRDVSCDPWSVNQKAEDLKKRTAAFAKLIIELCKKVPAADECVGWLELLVSTDTLKLPIPRRPSLKQAS